MSSGGSAGGFRRTRARRRRPALAVAAATAAIGVVIAAGCGTAGRAAEGNLGRGKQLFQENCASCHTLADAEARGAIGPNLDEAFRYVRDEDLPGQGYDESTIRDVIRDQIAYPVEDPPTDAPGMPANIVEGEDADAVAAYVASVAGLPVSQAGRETTPPGAGNAADGKSIFTASCGSCHTLADAGTSGTVGPNLDESKPTKDLAVERVTNGKGAMPPFKDQLSDDQIDAVAAYVAESAGN